MLVNMVFGNQASIAHVQEWEDPIEMLELMLMMCSREGFKPKENGTSALARSLMNAPKSPITMAMAMREGKPHMFVGNAIRVADKLRALLGEEVELPSFPPVLTRSSSADMTDSILG